MTKHVDKGPVVSAPPALGAVFEQESQECARGFGPPWDREPIPAFGLETKAQELDLAGSE